MELKGTFQFPTSEGFSGVGYIVTGIRGMCVHAICLPERGKSPPLLKIPPVNILSLWAQLKCVGSKYLHRHTWTLDQNTGCQAAALMLLFAKLFGVFFSSQYNLKGFIISTIRCSIPHPTQRSLNMYEVQYNQINVCGYRTVRGGYGHVQKHCPYFQSPHITFETYLHSQRFGEGWCSIEIRLNWDGQ